MSLRKQTLIIIGATILGLLLILYTTSRVILLGSFTRLEEQNTHQEVARVLDNLSEDLDRLSRTAKDWAAWDDTYAFIGGTYDGYVNDNLTDSVFTNLGINLMLFTDSSGRLVYGKAFDLLGEREVTIPESLQEYLGADAPLVRHPDVESSVTGYLLLPEGPILVASQPVVTSAGEGPIIGALIMGYYLNSEQVERLAEKTHSSVTVYRLDDPQLPSDFQAARAALSDQSPILARPLNAKSMAGYTMLNDINGEPILVLRIDMPRDIYQQGQASISYFVGSLAIVSLVFGIVTLSLLERRILSRLANLSARIGRIGESGDLSMRMPVAGHDELSELAGTINWMLDRLQESEEKFRKISASAQDAIIMIDSEGNISFWNTAAERIFGHSSQEALGQELCAVLAPERYYEACREAFSKFQRVGQGALVGKTTELEALRKDGTRFPIELSLSGVKLGSKWNAIGIIRDITERKQAEDELRQAKEKAEVATHAKSEFLANMSHEIRTPMNAIIGMTELLLDSGLSSEQREYAEIIRNGGDDLLAIINDILDFSKIESGKLELEERTFNLRDCVEGALDLLAPKAAEKGLELVYIVDNQTPEALAGDVTRLRQILVNLLSNAVKFTESGEIVVSVTCRRVTEQQCEIHFAVKDTGIGIPEEKMERLFQSFSQLDASTTRRYGGTGLGLVISKRLSEMMGGTMWVESDGTPGQGSTFHFTFLAKVASRQESVYLRSHQPSVSGKRLLIVDDNASNRRILRQQAQTWGMLPQDTASGSEALEWIRRGDPFDVAILDMHMPEMSGLTLAAEIRKYRDSQTLPLVMLTSLGQSREASQDGGQDFAAFLSKPVKSSQLYETLAGILGKQPTPARELAAQPRIDPQQGRSHPLRILLAEDNPVNQKVALVLLEKMGYRADVAATGRKVLEMLAHQSYDVVLMDVHMPEMDGLEATRRIREQLPADRQPQIIAMTASAMREDQERCLEAGMDSFISKPVRAEDLAGVLSRCQPLSLPPDAPPGLSDEMIQESGAIAASETSIAAFPKPRAPVEAIDTAVLDDLRASIGEAVPGLVNVYLENASKLLGSMRQAVAQGDSQSLFHAAHTLKPGSASLGAIPLATLCEELEGMSRSGSLEGAPEKVEQVEAEYARVKATLEALL
jgi:PAS domain S-box-containing protein